MLITTLVSFFIVFSLLVLAHELGHFLVARRAGIRVDEFGLGYPPRLLSLGHWGGTHITLNWIPFGGFVRLAGEDDPWLPGSFASRSAGVRAAILVAGAGMNIVLAVVLFSATAMIGEPVPITTAQVTEVAMDSPAAEAGLREGDLILAIDGIEVEESLALVRLTEERLGQEVQLLIGRGQEHLRLRLTPRANPPAGEGPMGIAIATLITGTRLVSHPLWESIPIGFDRTWRAASLIVLAVSYMLRGLSEAQVAGPIGIAQMTGEVAQLGAPFLLQFTAFLSVNLALINLLPFPGLDGGRLAFVVLEALRGGKRVDPRREGLVHFIGIAILIGFVLVISYFDILRSASG